MHSIINIMFERRLNWVLLFAFLASSFILIVYAAPGLEPDQFFPVYLKITESGETETIIFSDRTSSFSDGNWISLSGGWEISIPSLSLFTDVFGNSSLVVNGVEVNVSSVYSSTSLEYPFSSHRVYIQGETVTAYYRGRPENSGDILTWRLIGGDLVDLTDAFNELAVGESMALKGLISQKNTFYEKTGVSLNQVGDVSTSFSAPMPGSYVLVLLNETENPYSLTIYGFTLVNVADYRLEKTFDSTEIKTGSLFKLYLALLGSPQPATRSFGLFLIRDSAYSFDLEYTNNPTGSLLLNGETILDENGLTLGTDLDPQSAVHILRNIFGEGNIAIGLSMETQQTEALVAASTAGLNEGTYKALILVWETGAETRITSVDVMDIHVGEIHAVNGYQETPLTPSLIEAVTSETGYELLEDKTNNDIAEILIQVGVNKSAAVLQYFDPERIHEILVLFPLDRSIEIMQLFGDETLEDLLLCFPPENKKLFKGLMETRDERLPGILENVVKSIYGLNVTEKGDKLNDLGELLGILDEGLLFDLLNQIAGLPETPLNAARILMTLDSGLATNISCLWISSGYLDSLSDVLDYLPIEEFELHYTAWSGGERMNIYPYLNLETLSSIPRITSYRVNEILVTPVSPKIGEVFTIMASIENIGEETDLLEATLMLDNEALASIRDMVVPGGINLITQDASINQPGEHRLSLLDQSISLYIEAGQATELEIESLNLYPETVQVGENFTVYVDIFNPNTNMVSADIPVYFDDMLVYNVSVNVSGGSNTMLQFTLASPDQPGEYDVVVGEYLKRITVERVRSDNYILPTLVVILVLIVLIIRFREYRI